MSAEKPPVRFQRANFIVTDIERALLFYRDVLKFKVAFQKESEKDSYSYPVFEIDRDCKMQWAVLSAEGQPRVMALTEVTGKALASVPHPRRSAIVLDIADVDSVVEGARKLGLKVYEEERLETHDGRIGREIGIVDADENLVVIYNIPEAA